MSYTDVFGNTTLPPAEYGYAGFALTGNATFVWPYNSDGAIYTIAKVMDFTCQAGNYLTLPDATQVSTGEDFLVRNTGANALIVKDSAGTQVASVSPGAASYLYLTSNATAAGVFGVIGFGVGTSTVDAASLVGYGIKAVGASLNQSHPVVPTSSGITLADDHRSKLVVFTGGVATFALTSAATLGDDYFTMFRNDGTGTATIDPAASELIDGMTSMQVQPGESLILICTGTKWYSVGYGRSTLYQFTQLTKDVSAGGTITLSAAEAANKLITFIGNPAGAVNVVVPSVVAVYYTLSSISTAQVITLKTAAGSGVGITQGGRIIALCDGTNVVAAQSATANTSVSLTDGSASVPSLFFATQTNTGLFKSGTQDLGITINGVQAGVFGSTGLQIGTIGPNSTQRHTVPAVASDTVALLTATQTLANKTIAVDNNTVSGVAASSFVLSNGSGNIDGAAAQKAIPSGVVVGTTDSQTLTNKTLTTPTLTLKQSAAPVPTSEGDIQWDTDGDFIVVGNGAGQTAIPSASSTHTFTNKTLALGSNTVSGTTAQFNAALTDNDFATLAGVETLTNKTIGLTNNTFSGTKAQFDTALSDDNFAYVGQANTFTTNQTISSGNLSLSGTGQRIIGDFSNDTIANRVMFQTSTVNGASVLGVLPNGTSTTAYSLAHNASDPTNAGYMGFGINSTESHLTSDRAGTGTYLPMTFYTGGSERMRIDTSGNVGIGSTNTENRLTVNGNIEIYQAVGSLRFSSTPNKSTNWHIGANISDSVDDGLYFGQGVGFSVDDLWRLHIAANGDVLVTSPAGLGYGTGAGGTVTQATSKSTAVTLNKPTGQITMNNAVLGAGASVLFALNNSVILFNDLLLLGTTGGGNYRVDCVGVFTGGATIRVTNISGGSLSDALVVRFAIIKGATA